MNFKLSGKISRFLPAINFFSYLFKQDENYLVIPLPEYIRTFGNIATNDGLVSVRRLLSLLRNGFPQDLLSPLGYRIATVFYGNPFISPRDAGKSLVAGILEDDVLYRNIPSFKEFEDEQAKIIGNRSTILPFYERRKGILNFYEPTDPLVYDSLILSKSIEIVSSLLEENSLRPATLLEVLEKSEKSTQWGLPYWIKGNSTYYGTPATQLYYELALRDVQNKKVTWFPSAMVTRTTSSGTPRPKQRVAWALPHSIILNELRYQMPLLQSLKNISHFSEALSMERTDLFVTEIFKIAKSKGHCLIGFDVSSYDSSLTPELISGAYHCMRKWFIEEDEMLNSLQNYMLNSDIITPAGVYVGRKKGVASGSGLTNLIDSLCQLILFHYVRMVLGIPIADCWVVVNGDDGVWYIPGLTPELLSSILKGFNLTVHPDKVSYSGDFVTFCQRYYHVDVLSNGYNIGIRSMYRTLNSMLSYERKRQSFWNSKLESVRIISQLINMENHPSHKQFVEILAEVDENKLGTEYFLGPVEFIRSAGGFEKVGEGLSYSSYDKERLNRQARLISSFSTIRYLNDIYISKS